MLITLQFLDKGKFAHSLLTVNKFSNDWFALVRSFPGEAFEADGHGVVVGATHGRVVLQDDVVHVEVAGRLYVVTDL